MLQFTIKMSGVRVDNYEHIEPVERCLTYEQFCEFPREVKDGILKAYNCGISKQVFTYLDMDDVYKIAIYLHYPAELQQLKDEYGSRWWQWYLRFGH